MAPAPTWLRSSGVTQALDGALIATVAAVGIAGHFAARTRTDVEAAPASIAILATATCAAIVLWWRRRRPLQMLGALLAIGIVANAIDEPGLFSLQVGIELMLVFFAAGAWGPHPRLAVGVATVFAVLIAAGAGDDGSGVLAAGAFALALVAFPLVAGFAWRAHRRYVDAVEQQLREAERDRDERARRAIQEERTRIARELHDVVAHHVSLIGVQAGAARTALDRSPETTRAALAAIEVSSRDAVSEMHTLLDVLRPLDGSNGYAPQPRLGELAALVERWRAAGFDIELRAAGPLEEVDALLSLCGYRIVEEALTNVARHSTARRVAVTLDVSAATVRVSVSDPGPARHPSTDGGARRGLAGMAERAALFGGEVTAGPTGDGGFAVAAVLPRVR
jgi:signal transduction histidine kinase